MKKIISTLTAFLFLTSCYSTYNSGTPEGVTVYKSSLSIFRFDKSPIDIANQHCAQYGKKAVLTDKSSVFVNKEVFKCEK